MEVTRILVKLFSIALLMDHVISLVKVYLSPDGYRDFKLIQGDFSSLQFFSYFEMNLMYYQNDPSLYMKNCENRDIFGYFRFGNISNYFDYNTYGALGINFKVVVLKEDLLTNPGDSLDFYLDHEKVSSLYLNDFSKNLGMKEPLLETNCQKEMFIYNISVIYTNTKDAIYPPILFAINANFDTYSNIDWGVSEIELVKVSCPAKCTICNSTQCIGCSDPNSLYKPSVCYCDDSKNYYDYADKNEPITCKQQYLAALDEDYTEPFINTSWFWNGYNISPFYFKTTCPINNATFFGGYRTFGDSDVLSKLMKFNDKSIFGVFMADNSEYVNIANYKIDISIAYFNWDIVNSVLEIAPMTQSSPLDLLIAETIPEPCDIAANTDYYSASYSYEGLYDNSKYANISIIMSTVDSRKNNNFGLSKFTFSISPCFKTCLTCADPSYDSCQTCVDANAEIVNGMCECKSGFARDPFNPTYPCVNVITKSIITSGAVSTADLGYGAILSNNMASTSHYCNSTRVIIGGYVSSNKSAHSLDIVTSDVGITSYMKQITLELITEEDNSLIPPFLIRYNGNQYFSNKDFSTSQIKYLKFTDSLALLGIDCYDGQVPSRARYKSYYIDFYLFDDSLITDLSIINDNNIFWGVLTYSINYFGCHSNCNACNGYGIDKCTICKPGMILNPVNYNSQNKTSSCICDSENGFFQTSETYDPLTCTKGSSANLTSLYINDLNSEEFTTEQWMSAFGVMTREDIITCESEVVLGKYNPQNLVYMERQFNLTQNIQNFDYFFLDFSFDLFIFRTIANYVIKVFIDDQYIWGQFYSATQSGNGYDEMILCDSGDTIFYKKTAIFSFYNSDYYGTLINADNPIVRIQLFPDSECLYNSQCGWGINNFQVKVNRVLPNTNSTCSYKPFSLSPCADATVSPTCFPGYYSNRLSWGEFECLNCPTNCLECNLPTNCNTCLPGYSILNFVCVPSPKVMNELQTNMLIVDLNRHFKNLLYPFEGTSINLWFKSITTLTSLDKPLFLMDPFLLSYNSTTVSYSLKFTNYNYLFAFSQMFPLIMNYTIDPGLASVHESSWIPISLSIASNFMNTQFKTSFFQLSINNGDTQAAIYNNAFLPTQIILFNYFSKTDYRFMKMWDRFIPVDILNKANYITDYSTTPSDMILFYRLIEGIFKNTGSSNLIYIYNTDKFTWKYDASAGPTSCSENQFYDSNQDLCIYCNSQCSHCYDTGANSCIECKDPFPFLDKASQTCKQICPNNLVANYRYPTLKTCQNACSPECKTCDYMNGCTECVDSYLLFNNTCISHCTPTIADQMTVQCLKLASKCSPSITITDKQPFFLLDGSNLKLEVNVINCGETTFIKWQSSINPKNLIINNKGQSLYVDATTLKIPEKETFNVFLYDYSQTVILAKDSVEIDLVTTAINGGNVIDLYMNETFVFSAEYFDTYVASKLSGVEYSWTCPVWVSIQECNPKMNTPVISVNGSNIQSNYFEYDVLWELIINVSVNQVKYTTLYGFMVVYSELNIYKYLSFNITEETNVGYNSPAKYQINFQNEVDYSAIKYDITIQWSINTTNIVPINSDKLPVFLFTPTGDSFGTFNLTCQIFYRKGSPVEKSLSQSVNVYIPPPPSQGVLIVSPTEGSAIITPVSFYSYGYTPSSSSLSGENVYTYQYFYLNPFEEYILITHKNTTVFFDSKLPPTSKVKMKLFYSGTSFIETLHTVNIKPTIGFDYINQINNLFSLNPEDTLSLLEICSLNFRADPSLITSEQISSVSDKIVDKIYEILSLNLKKNTTLPMLFSYLDKLGTSLEATTYRMEELTKMDTLLYIYNTTFYIANDIYKNPHIFSQEQNNNFLRSINNVVGLFNKTSTIDLSYFQLIYTMQAIIDFSSINIDIGVQKNALMKNLEISSTIINSDYLRKDVVFTFNRANRDGELISTEPRLDIYTDITNKSNANTSLTTDNRNITSAVTIPANNWNGDMNNIVVQVAVYPNFNQMNLNTENILKSKSKVKLVPNIIEATFVKISSYEEPVKPNSTTSSTASTTTTGSKRRVRRKYRYLTASTSNSTNSSNTTNLTEYIRVKEYSVIDPYFDSSAVIINFTLPNGIQMDLVNKTTCISLEGTMGEDEEAVCNTWFDFKENIIQCECDYSGLYTIVFDPDFQYVRKSIQFPQFNDSITQPWGWGTLIFLLLLLFLFAFWAYKKDKRELTELNNASLKKEYYQDFRSRMKSKMANLKTVTFSTLFTQLFLHANDFYSLKFYKDFYFLRLHRALVLVFRMYMVIMFCFWKQQTVLDPVTAAQVQNRDITLKSDRFNVFNWNGDWSSQVIESVFIGLPIGLIMVLYPKLSEWLFKYNENDLRYLDNTAVVTQLGIKHFETQLSKCKSLTRQNELHQNIIKLNKNIELHIIKNQPEVGVKTNHNQMEDPYFSAEEVKFNLDSKRYRAYINFNKMISSILFDVRYNIYLNEKQDYLPEDLAPIYVKKLQGQVEKYENRMCHIKNDLHKGSELIEEDDTSNKKIQSQHRGLELFKDKAKVLSNLDSHFEGKDANLNELMNRYGYQENFKIGFRPKAKPSDNLISNEINNNFEEKTYKEIKEQELKEEERRKEEEKKEKEKKEIIEKEEKERIEQQLKNTVFKNPPNALIPHLIGRNKTLRNMLFFKLAFLVLLIAVLIFFITSNLILVRNQGGNAKAIFWVILAAFSLVENYIIFLPLLCIIKTIILRRYGTFYPKTFLCNAKMVLFAMVITDVDRAIFKELSQCVKNNNHEKEDNITNEDKMSEFSKDLEESDMMLTSKYNEEKNMSFSNIQLKNDETILDQSKINLNIDKSHISLPYMPDYNNQVSVESEGQKSESKSGSPGLVIADKIENDIKENKKNQSNLQIIPEYLEHHDFELDEEDDFQYTPNMPEDFDKKNK